MSDRRHGRKAFLDRENAVANPSVDSVQSDKNVPDGLAFKIERLHEQDLLPLVTFLLLRRDDVSNNPGDNHDSCALCGYSLSTLSTIATIAASVGTSSGLNANAASRPRQT